MTDNNDDPTCGIVMPISSIDGCSERHWADVKDILDDAIRSAGFSPKLVSASDDVGVIQKRLVENLYENAMVVCDVSGKNPNVMFELGMRLAFDKPAIIVKDDKTSYSFDTSPIEHITYPRDLRFAEIVAFKQTLRSKIAGTMQASKVQGYTTFLGHFGTFEVADLKTVTVPAQDLILSELAGIRSEMSKITRQERSFPPSLSKFRHQRFSFPGLVGDRMPNLVTAIANLKNLFPQVEWSIDLSKEDQFSVQARALSGAVDVDVVNEVLSNALDGLEPDKVSGSVVPNSQ